MIVYVLTNVDNGWDCVIGVFKSQDEAFDYLNSHKDENQPEYVTTEDIQNMGYVLHLKNLKL